jgi:multiple sugar transport system permease protein
VRPAVVASPSGSAEPLPPRRRSRLTRGSTRSWVSAALVNGALLLLALGALGPLLWMVSVSFMPAGQTSTYPPPLLPHGATLDSYRTLFELPGMGRRVFNSALLAVLATGVSLAFNVTAGYGFAKLRFRGRERMFKGLLGALIIPGQVTMIPLFLMMKYMGLVNTYAGVLVPSLASVFGIFLVRQYALSIPDELLEAARIDGANELRTFVSVVLPGLVPIVVTLAVFSFLGSWNDFLWPLIMLSDDDRHTLPLALAALSREHVQDRELMMAGSVVTLVPVLVVFLVLQRYYMQGLLAGSVKG